MELAKSSQINGIILLVLGFWGYYLAPDPLFLIFPIGGGILLILNFFLKKGNKTLLYSREIITMLLSLFLLYYLIFFTFNLGFTSIFRIVTMLFSCIVSIVIFVKKSNNRITLGRDKRAKKR